MASRQVHDAVFYCGSMQPASWKHRSRAFVSILVMKFISVQHRPTTVAWLRRTYFILAPLRHCLCVPHHFKTAPVLLLNWPESYTYQSHPCTVKQRAVCPKHHDNIITNQTSETRTCSHASSLTDEVYRDSSTETCPGYPCPRPLWSH